MVENNTNARVALRLAVEAVNAGTADEEETLGLASGYLEWLNENMEEEADPTPKRSGKSSGRSQKRKSSGGSGDSKGKPTQKQKNWAKRLLKDRDHDLDVTADDLDDMTFGEVSSLIDELQEFDRTD